MSATLVHFITAYGYWAIFWLIFLQEIGVPNPVSNEFVLLFSGSLGYTGLLSFPLILLTAIFADVLGAMVLYTIFHFFGRYLLAKRPKWLPISQKNIDYLHELVKKHGMWGVFLGRMLPFARGYAAVAGGLFDIKWGKFIIAVVASALVWSGGFVTLGMISGKYILQIENTTGGVEKILVIAILATIAILVIRSLTKKKPVT
jgi:alkaline phosphatase